MLGGKGGGEGRSYEDEGQSFSGNSGKKRVASGPSESFTADLDDEIPF
jgi:hypothetical protein